MDDRPDLPSDHDDVAAAIVGTTVAHAQAWATDHGRMIRVAKLDGEHRMLTRDLRFNRINIAVVDGVVTSVIDFG